LFCFERIRRRRQRDEGRLKVKTVNIGKFGRKRGEGQRK
jgi:hypothetical protein